MHSYEHIISIDNLLESWREFLRDKKRQKEVMEFRVYLMDNLSLLYRELLERTYRHGPYRHVKINDPKPRDIHIAFVRDRLLHHAMYRVLYPYFDRTFIFDSYSCRRGKGTHRGINRFREYARDASHNHARTVWVLKCDIRKFFANIDHGILKEILARHIEDVHTLGLLGMIIDSFHTKDKTGTGLPLGNLTSQLLVNLYMNEFDQFVKHTLHVTYYIRYADDFVILHTDQSYLENLIPTVAMFLKTRLALSLHPQKVFIKTYASGVDFLGWVHFSRHRVLRTTTKRRMLGRLSGQPKDAVLDSYLGLLSHGNTHRLRQKIKTMRSAEPRVEFGPFLQ
ncbi:MAG TPA: reverse transcriptase/maturase family protein [Candidatus Paceibacterota bacterium]